MVLPKRKEIMNAFFKSKFSYSPLTWMMHRAISKKVVPPLPSSFKKLKLLEIYLCVLKVAKINFPENFASK